MAIATGTTTTSLLSTAGLSPDQYGLDVLLDMPNNSVFMQGNRPALVDGYVIGRGSTLKAPVIGARSARTRVRGTDDGNGPTFDSLSDTAVSFSKRFAYNAFRIDYMGLNDMPPEHLRATLQGHREQMTMGLANQLDTDLLGLYSSAANSVGGAGQEFTIANLAAAKKLLKVANAPGRIVAVLPATQEDHLATTDELTRYDIRGEGMTAVDGPSNGFYRWQGIDIYTTGNVPTASSIAHGLVFSTAGIRVNFRDLPVVRDWDDPDEFSQKLMVYVDYVYANTFTDWIVDFQTTDA